MAGSKSRIAKQIERIYAEIDAIRAEADERVHAREAVIEELRQIDAEPKRTRKVKEPKA